MEKKARTPTSETSRRQRSVEDAEENQSQDEYNSMDEEPQSAANPDVAHEDQASARLATETSDLLAMYEDTSSQRRQHERDMEEQGHRLLSSRSHDREAQQFQIHAARPRTLTYSDFAAQDDQQRFQLHGPPLRRPSQRPRVSAERADDDVPDMPSQPNGWQEPPETDARDQQLSPAEMVELIRHLRMTIENQQTTTVEDAAHASDSETNYESAVEAPAHKSSRRRTKKKIHFQMSTTRPEDRRQGGGDAGCQRPMTKKHRPVAEEEESSDEEPEPEPEPMSTTTPNVHRPRKGAAVPFRTFDGKRWPAFKRQFDSACLANKIPDEDRGARLECALVGEATDVLGEEAQTYDQLVATLNARYGETKAKKEVLLEIMQMKRQASETVLVFADRMKRVARSGGLKPDENAESLYMAFINGLADYSDTLTAVCKKCKSKTLDAAAQVASKYEMLHGRTPSSKTEAVKTSWGLVASATSHPVGDKTSAKSTTAAGDSPLGTAILDRVVKLERETEKIATLTKTFNDDVKATRLETKEVNNALLALKTRYEENEAQRAAALARRYPNNTNNHSGGYNRGRRDGGHSSNSHNHGHGQSRPQQQQQA